MFHHVVLFRWRDAMPPEAVAAIEASLAELPGRIPEIRSFVYGPDAGRNETGWDFAVAASFDSVDDWLAYRDNADHRALVAEHITPWTAERAAVQFDAPRS